MPAVKASGSKTQAAASGKGKRKQAPGSDESEDEDDSDETEQPAKKTKNVSARDALSKALEEEDHVEVQDGDKSRSLQDLRATYGSNFRLVADAASTQKCPWQHRRLLPKCATFTTLCYAKEGEGGQLYRHWREIWVQ